MAEISIEVYCSCGNGLCNQTTCKKYGVITIEPCEDCLQKAKEEGYNAGAHDGQNERDNRII